MKKQHTQWASKLGFVLATAGAAIGLGNLWKFPYLMGENGGFPFLIMYLFFICILGIPVMIAEMSLGRKTGADPVQAYRTISPRAGIVGGFGVTAAFLILSYYSVIGGWLLKYFFSYLLTFQAPADFSAFIGQTWEPVGWHLVFMLVTAGVCVFGTRGIEKASKIMMPLLFIILMIIIVRSITLPGAGTGLKFIFSPENSSFHINSVSAALGQVFYSLSLCMGITVTYGSYLSKKENIVGSCLHVAALDTLVAVLAGIAIFPAVFSFGLEADQGPQLIFVTLPKVFEAMAGGWIFAVLFFMLILMAAITSAIALLEVSASFVIDAFGCSRRAAVGILTAGIFLTGVPSSMAFGALKNVTVLNYNFFDFVGMITDNILLPIGGLLMCYFLGWKWDINLLAEEVEQEGNVFRLKKAWKFCIRFITPLLVLAVTVSGMINVASVVMG